MKPSTIHKLIFTLLCLTFDTGVSASHYNPNNASIIVWGQGGAGISSTVQSLLGPHAKITIAPTTGNSSTITEYTIPLKSVEGPTNHLKIVDVNGLNSFTEGQDASTISELFDYIGNTDQGMGGYYPNYFLIISSFPDNKFQDENSDFVKMLRKIAKFQEMLLAQNNETFSSNNLIVLSKLMKENELLQKKPETKTSLFRTTLAEFVPNFQMISRSIMVGENKPEENNLPTKNGFIELPNNSELYPKNILDKLVTSSAQKDELKKASDLLQLFISMRGNSESIDVIKTTFQGAVTAEKIKIHLDVIDGGVKESQASIALRQAYEEQVYAKGQSNHKSRRELLQLQLFFQSKSIFGNHQLPKLKTEQAKLFLDMMEFSNDFGNQAFLLLKSAFALEPPFMNAHNTQNVSIIVLGKGGTGLSSTVQKILGTSANITMVDKKTVVDDSEGCITEYEISLPNTKGALKIVDVEGIIEGKPPGHDKKVFLCLASYLADDNGLGGYLPNFWLIVSNFDDNKFLGPKSSLVRMLTKIEKLQAVMHGERLLKNGTQFKNVMLFTKIMSMGGNSQRNPETRLALFSNAVKEYASTISLTGKPLVGDNMWGQDKISSQTGFVTLPNNELYPGNIIEEFFRNSKDDFVAQPIIGKFREIRKTLASYKVVSSFY